MADPVNTGLDTTLPLETFNNVTIATGGDSKLYNLNVFYNVGSRLASNPPPPVLIGPQSRPATSPGC